MSIPHEKQSHLTHILDTVGHIFHLDRIPPAGRPARATRPVGPGPRPGAAPSNPGLGNDQTTCTSWGAAVLMLMTVLAVIQLPGVQAANNIFPDDFEHDTLGQDPQHQGFTYTKSNQNSLVSDIESHSGNQSFRMVQQSTTDFSRFQYTGTATNFCHAHQQTFWLWMASYAPGTSGADTFKLGSLTTTIVTMTVGNAGDANPGQVKIGSSGELGQVPLSTWVDFRIWTSIAGGACDGGSHLASQCLVSSAMSINFCTTDATISPASGTYNQFEINVGSTTLNGRPIYIDDVGPCEQFTMPVRCEPVPIIPVITGTQVAITNLVGGSMDGRGETIVVRYNGGTDVATYGTQDLGTQIASEATGCLRSDGVVATTLNDDVWITYASCTVASTVDALRIRDQNLATPVFPNDCEGEPTADVENNADIDVPNNMQQIGTLSDLSFDFEECVNVPGPGRVAVASWTFSSSVDGWIGAFGVMYGQDTLAIDHEVSNEETVARLDTSAGPWQVDDFCSWVGSDGNDYIAGVSSDGVAAVYQVMRDVDFEKFVNEEPDAVDFTFIQKFRNSGPYAGSSSIACAQDKVAIQTPTEIRILDNITTTPVLFRIIPNVPVVSRDLAFTGSGEYLAYVTSAGIKTHQIDTGNTTGIGATPGGTWRSMEFDFSGQNLVAFTSTFITLFDSEEVTCELDSNCEQLGSVGDDQAGPTTTSTQTTTGGTGGGVENLSESPYFWVLVWLLLINVVIAIISWRTRAGFGGSVYLVASFVVYAIGIIGYGPDQINPWPLVATLALVISLAVAGYVQRR